ncbi:hypothetical protein ABIB83_008099 [Bradyrhizobium sp. I1.8.5]
MAPSKMRVGWRPANRGGLLLFCAQLKRDLFGCAVVFASYWTTNHKPVRRRPSERTQNAQNSTGWRTPREHGNGRQRYSVNERRCTEQAFAKNPITSMLVTPILPFTPRGSAVRIRDRPPACARAATQAATPNPNGRSRAFCGELRLGKPALIPRPPRQQRHRVDPHRRRLAPDLPDGPQFVALAD